MKCSYAACRDFSIFNFHFSIFNLHFPRVFGVQCVIGMSDLLIIDGSYGEGGGQILRTSLTLSAILGRPIRIENIRAGRRNPGLQPQHLTAARAVASICGGELAGDQVGSQVLDLRPGRVEPGDYVFDVSQVKASAGSVNLIFQTVLLPLALAGRQSRITIRGGTHVPWSPPANYVDNVYLAALERMGLLAAYRVERAGYYPIGGGEIRAEIRPVGALQPLKLTARSPGSVTCFSAVSNLPRSIAERQMAEATARLRTMGIQAGEVIEDYPSAGKGTVVFILYDGSEAKAGFTGLGERGKPAEKVAQEAADEFAAWWASGAALDKHLADQLVVPMALADGESAFTTAEITQHLLTNIWTVSKFLPARFEVDGEIGAFGMVRRLSDED